MTYDLVFIHLLNDYSGSPKVLKNTIAAATTQWEQSKLYVGSGTEGFLSRCSISTCHYWYRRTGHRLLTLFTFLFSQVVLFFKLLCDRSISKDAVIYVNTLLPFGAALYGRLTARKVIYHVHEISITPAPLKCLLTTVARMTSSLNIYVSEAHMLALPIPIVPARRVYNALDTEFIAAAGRSIYTHHGDGTFNILMIASLRDYKGVPELLALAESLRDHAAIRFDLVVNDDLSAIERYFSGRPHPGNLTIHPRINDTTAFYDKANLVLNLSRVDQCIETFGMTILEAMAFGIPVIVPPVGGPTELVKDGVEGFLVDSRDTRLLKDKLLILHTTPELCMEMSAKARKKATLFSPDIFAENIRAAIKAVCS